MDVYENIPYVREDVAVIGLDIEDIREVNREVVYNEAIDSYRLLIASCQKDCTCVFNHDTADIFHSQGRLEMSNILPAICKDHVTSIFGLDEDFAIKKHVDRSSCSVTEIGIPRIVARSLYKDTYAFLTNDIILPSVNSNDLAILLTVGIDDEAFRDVLTLSEQLKNFFRSLQVGKIPVQDVCRNMNVSNATPCNRRIFNDVCGLWAYLSYNIFNDNANHGEVIPADQIARQVLGDLAAIQIQFNTKIIRDCIKQFKLRPDVLDKSEDFQRNAVRNNFISRCELRLANVEQNTFTPNVQYLDNPNRLVALRNFCDRERLRVEVAENAVLNALRDFNNLYPAPGAENTVNVTNPPLSERKRNPIGDIQYGAENMEANMRPTRTAVENMEGCRFSIGLF